MIINALNYFANAKKYECIHIIMVYLSDSEGNIFSSSQTAAVNVKVL